VRQQQISTVTNRGRHVPLMRHAGSGRTCRRILSFGCSDGSECLDLADVFPDAEIVGCDVNAKALERARETCADRATIVESSPAALLDLGPFDAVFVLSVLCRYPKSAGLDDVSAVYPVEEFDRTLREIDACLAPGGVLALYNAQYFFEDAGIFPSYAALGGVGFNRNGWIEKSLRDGRRITDVIWNFDGREMDRATFAIWMRDPVNKENARLRMDRLTYRHDWIDPSAAGHRSTAEAVWIKRG